MPTLIEPSTTTDDSRVLHRATIAQDDSVQGHPRNAMTFSSEFTIRERDILKLMTQGKSNPEIARTLFISQSTVKTHLRSIFKKMGVEHRVQAAVIAVQQGLFKLDNELDNELDDEFDNELDNEN
ncbi:MAG: response regulator transcription factor [Oculatellaceae cyanobacterium Prado106]|nr:response regulator transcription factor [Oculatellaceae cyanobacterium Prado106]